MRTFLFFGLMVMLISCSGEESVASYSEGGQIRKFTHKDIPEEIKAEALEALTHYPELTHTPISFIFEEKIVNSFMQAQPRIGTIFRRGDKRNYVVKMTRHMKVDDELIPIEQLPHDVVVGWLGHELGHIVDYQRKNSFGMIWFGANYLLSDSYKIEAETEADMNALRHGLAPEIIATKNYILSSTSLSETYKQRIKRLYLSPEEILELVEKLDDKEEESALIN